MPPTITVTSPTASPVTFPGLTFGTHYTFRVFATNVNGQGAVGTSESDHADGGCARCAHRRERGPRQRPGDGLVHGARRRWRGADHLVHGDTIAERPPASGAGSPITVTGLTNGTDYTFTVTATNSVGTGAASLPSNHVVPLAVPGAPTNVVGTAGDGTASIAFTAPTDNGGSPITSYTVTSTVGGFTASSATSPIVVSGLVNVTDYAFTVTATNAAGTGPPSVVSNDVIPFAPPGAPTAVSASVSGVGAVILNCTAPADQGSGIAFYRATSSPGGIIGDGLCPYTVSGLTVGVTYTFTLVPVGPFWVGATSAPSNAVTAATVPGAPTAVTATSTSDSLVALNFTPPASDGGSPVTFYQVVTSPPTVGPLLFARPAGPVHRIGPHQGHRVHVHHERGNLAGDGLPSRPSNSVTPVTPPVTDVRAMGGDGRVAVSFVRPLVTPASPVTSYVATASPGGITGTSPPHRPPSTSTGLTDGTSYTFTVTANHADGSSETSAPSNVGHAREAARADEPLGIRPQPPGRPCRGDRYLDQPSDQHHRRGRGSARRRGECRRERASMWPTKVSTTVSVIDTAAQAVVATIPLSDPPFGIAVDPSGAHVYVTTPLASSVSVIDAASNTVTDTIPIPGPAIGIEVDPSGASVYVSLTTSQQIVRIDAASKSVAATSAMLYFRALRVGGGRRGRALRFGRRVGPARHVLGPTLQQQSITAFSDVVRGTGVAVDPADGHVYFARGPFATAGTLNQLGGASAPVGSGVSGVAVTPTGGQVYVADEQSNSVTVVDGASMTVVATIPVGDLPIGFGRFIAPADPNPPRLDNISTRMDVLTGDNVMIGGFIIGGSTPKTVVIRGDGPSLAAFGMAGVLANPDAHPRALVGPDRHRHQRRLAGRGERGRQFSRAASLPECARISGDDDARSGRLHRDHVGRGRLHRRGRRRDLRGRPSRHAARGHLHARSRGCGRQRDDRRVDRAGLRAENSGGARRRGPSLAGVGGTGLLANPTLTIVRSSDHAIIATNDDWQSGPSAAAIQAAGLQPGDPAESAILITLDRAPTRRS